MVMVHYQVLLWPLQGNTLVALFGTPTDPTDVSGTNGSTSRWMAGTHLARPVPLHPL